MVNHTAMDNKTETNKTSENNKTKEDGPFLWSTTTRGLQLSAYFWGYMAAQLPGGRISEIFSAKWVFFFAVAINILFTLLTPLLAHLSAYAVVFSRIMSGIGGGVSFPATHALLAHWAPPAERTSMSATAYCGTAAGTVIFILFAGLIADGLGWMWVFYIEGGASCIWLIFWIIFITDKPETQHFMTAAEKEFIKKAFEEEGEGGTEHSNLSVPWAKVFTSLPFWAIIVAHLCSNWGWYLVLTELPSYMQQVLKFNIKDNAILTSIPYLCMFTFSLILGKLIDVLISKEIISTTVARKIATALASVVPMICFVALCFVTSPKAAVFLMTFAITSIGGMYCGFLSNHIDIAPNYAGTLMAITNTIATIPGIVVPIFVGWLTEKDESINSWRIVFYVTIALYLVEFTFYTIFASGKKQSWN